MPNVENDSSIKQNCGIVRLENVDMVDFKGYTTNSVPQTLYPWIWTC